MFVLGDGFVVGVVLVVLLLLVGEFSIIVIIELSLSSSPFLWSLRRLFRRSFLRLFRRSVR